MKLRFYLITVLGAAFAPLLLPHSLAQSNRDSGYAVLYSGKNYSGASYRLVPGEALAATELLDSSGLWPSQEFMVGSIEIQGGVTLELFNDPEYQGNMMKVSQSVTDIQRIRNRPIGSIRLAFAIADSGFPQTRSIPKPASSQFPKGEIRIYADSGFNGASLSYNDFELVGDLNRLSRSTEKWNDRISSIYIRGDYSVIIFQDANFKGHSLRLYESVSNMKDLRRRDPSKRNWNDAVSSFEIVSKNGESLYAADNLQYAGTLYEDDNFQGNYLALFDGQSIPNLRDERWNDKVSSLMVERGYKIILFKDSNYRGESISLDLHQPSLKSFSGRWNDEASSLKVISDR